MILGAGGHAKAISDAQPGDMTEDDATVKSDDIVAIGIGDRDTRKKLFAKFRNHIVHVIHPTAYVAETARLGQGAQVMARAFIGPNVTVGENVLINTGAQVDHDCIIGDNCDIAPGAILCGTVTLGEGCAIGAGAIIVQGVTLDAGTLIPAGSLVVEPGDIRSPQRVVQPGKD